MRFDLHQIAAQNGRRIRRGVKLRPIEPSTALEKDAIAINMRLVNRWREIMMGLLDAYEAALKVKTFVAAGDHVMGFDAAGDNLAVLIGSGAQTMNRYVLTLEADLARWSERVELWHRQKFSEGLKGGLGGMDIFPYLSGQDVEDNVAASIERNVALIKGLNAQLEKATGETVWREFLKQTPRREIGGMLQKELGIGRTRANLIAKDQTLKLSAQLNQERQEQVGIEEYLWRTAQDERVRPTHAVRDGKVYRWDNDEEIKPGEEINCRCTAQAYLPPLPAEGPYPGLEPEPELRMAGEEAEAQASVGEVAAENADQQRAAFLRKAEAAQAAAQRALMAAERQATSTAAKLTQMQSVGLAELQGELGGRAAASAALKVAEEKAAAAKMQENVAKIAAKKAQNAVTKLKAMQGASAEIDAIAEAAMKDVAQDPASAYSILTKAQKQIAKIANKATFAKEAWLKNYIAQIEKAQKAATSGSKASLQLEIDKAKAELAKFEPPNPADIISPPKIKPEDLTPVGSAKGLGGIKDKYFYTDKAGEKWLFKPAGAGFEWAAEAEEAASRIGKAVDPHSIEVHAMTVEGKAGSLQKFQTGSSNLSLQVDPKSLSATDIASIQREHVIDWAISNHDAHAENFLKMATGDLVGIDKGQAFKFLGKDKLNTTYHPNEHPPLYNKFWKQVQAGDIKFDPKATFDAIEKLQAIPDSEYKRWLRPYAEGRFGKGNTAEDFLHDALARKHQLKADFEQFFDELGLGKAATAEKAIASIEPAKGLIPPADAHGGNFASAIGLGGQFKSTYGFSSKLLGDLNGGDKLVLSGVPNSTIANFNKLEKAFQAWKQTGVLPKNLNILVPEKPPAPPPPPGTRDPKLGSVKSGKTEVMRKPKTTKQWEPISQTEGFAIQDVDDQAVAETHKLANSLSYEHAAEWGSYKSSGHRTLNAKLRQSSKSESILTRAKRLDELATFELPKDMMLIRGTTLPQYKSVEAALEATEFIDKGFFSASVDRGVAKGFMGSTVHGQQVAVQFTIRAKKGMKVIAGVGGEREFIFPRGTRWRILDSESEVSQYGTTVVHLLVEPW